MVSVIVETGKMFNPVLGSTKMYYEYQHQEGIDTFWVYCTVLDPTLIDNKLRVKYKLGPEEHEELVPIYKVRLVSGTNEMETSQ
jgi:hypothetical protein